MFVRLSTPEGAVESATVQAALRAALGAHYTIERELGRGGMASVHLARDLRHGRRVAVKVLHAELSAALGAERFLREIELTASLQHPHILPLFDSGAADGLLYYVMPYVEGETLRTRLARERQLPIGDALRIAREVADALGYAHDQGVVHRDVKPENILLHGGHALVADFGIAFAVHHAGGTRMTQTGVSLGTPQYMAPEQAMGEKSVDQRADIYALGVVTYEMLAGEPPFNGPTAQTIVARVLTDPPRSLTVQRPSVPPYVDLAVRTALEKLPADRFASAAAFTEALAGAAAATGAVSGAVSGSTTAERGAPRARWPETRVIVVGLAVLAATGTAAFLLGRQERGRPAIERFGHTAKLTWDPGLEIQPAISPDGRLVAYAAGTAQRTRVFVRQVIGGRAIAVTDDTTDLQTTPSWSPDGTRILFLTQGRVFSAPSGGGPARAEIPAVVGGEVEWAAWAPDGTTIAYTTSTALHVRADRGTPRRVAELPAPGPCAWAPDSRLVACASGNPYYVRVGRLFGNLSPSRIVVVRLDDGAVLPVADGRSLNHSPAWSPDGRWLYFVSDRDGTRDVYAAAMARDGTASGTPLRLTTGLDAQAISLSADGSRIVFNVLSATANVWSLPMPPAPPSTTERALPVTRGSQIVEGHAVSTDGRWLYYDSNIGGDADLYRMRLPRGEPERLTTDSTDEFNPAPSPDGREVAFHSWRSGSRDIHVMPLDGGPVQRVTASPGQEVAAAWSPDGRALAFSEYPPTGGIWVVRRNADRSWGTPVQRTQLGFWPSWSPDGRLVAFNGELAGGSLYVVPADTGAPRVVVDASQPGHPLASRPEWSEDGRTIYFKSHDARGEASIWAVPASGGTPRLLVRFGDPTRPSDRPEWTLRRGALYFSIEDRESDIWVMDVVPR